VSRLLRRSGRRYLQRHPWQLALSVLGIALGVAVVVSIDLANASAQRAFGISMEAVSGRATHQIVAGKAGLDESVYTDLRVELGLESIAPVVEGSLAIVGQGRIVRVLGIDPFAEAPFRSRLGGMFVAGEVPLSSFIVEPGTGVLAAATAQRLGLAAGDDLQLRAGTRRETIRLIGLLRAGSPREQQALGDLLVVDISVAQELFGYEGRLSRIDLVMPEDVDPDPWLEAVAARLPLGATIRPTAGRTRALASMTRAFRLNLTALSLLALIVGMFLIYNAMTFAVVQRRTQIGILRALGATRGEIARAILGEAAALGLCGTALGVGLGIVLGSGLVRLVTTTINDLYFLLTVNELNISPISLAKGAGLGIGATLSAALVPALEAANASPRLALGRSTLEERWRRGARRAGFAGALLIATGIATIGLTERSLAASFIGVFALIVGSALIAPALTVAVSLLLRPALGRIAGVLGAMAARGVVSSLSRTGVAVAALMTAVAVTISVGIMIDSFRQTVVLWLSSSLVADVYVSPPDMTVGNPGGGIDPRLVEALAKVPGARASANVHRVDVPMEDGASTRLVVLGVGEDSRPRYDLREGEFDAIWPAFRDGRGVLVSEPYARRYEVEVGDRVRLLTDRGDQVYPVLGVYRDYSTEQGIVALHRSAYLRSWDDLGFSGVAFFLQPGYDIEKFMAALVDAAGPEHEILVQSNRAIREEAIAIFDRTFTITVVLRALTVVVAFVGVLSALMALQLERVREFGVLRANGLTPGQVWRLVVLQTGLMGLVAGLLSLPVGVALSWVMIHVINRRAFGWTLSMVVDPLLLAQAVAVSLGASVLAGLYPAWKLAGTSPALALREE
jgi:putative ABC transport system permease protein